jgi:hypothetical protein
MSYLSWATDVLVYIVVLNLFVEFVDTVVIDSFWISILTAALLKGLLVAIGGVEHRVAAWFRGREKRIVRVVGLLVAFGILFVSKFLILELVDLVFGDEVDLGGFVEIVLIVVAMMGSAALAKWIFDLLGPPRTG